MTHSRFHAVLLTVALLLCGRYACHAQKTTVDPNAGRQSKLAEEHVADARLAKKVTCEAWHAPLKTILANVSGSTGVTLCAGYNKYDWQVRDRKMNIYVKDATLEQLMSSIARVMRFKWSCNNDVTPPTYRLIADRRLLAKLQAEASKRERELKQEEIKRRTALVEALAKVADLSGGELEALKTSNPYLYVCADTGFAKLVTQVFSEEPQLRDVFTHADKNVSPPMEVFTPATQQLCAGVMRKLWPLENDGEGLPDDLEQILGKYYLHMGITSGPFESDLHRRLYDFGGFGTHIPTGDYGMGCLRDPNAKSSQSWAKCLLATPDQGAGAEDYRNQVYSDLANAERTDAKEIEYYLMFDPVVEHPDEPELNKKIEVKVTEAVSKSVSEQVKALGDEAAARLWYQAMLRLVGDAAAMNVVSDSFAVVLGDQPQITDKDELSAILDKLCDAYKCNWEKHGSIIEIRRRDWFRRRASQIPDEWIRPWREELEKNGILTLDSYARMVTLTEDQIEENLNSDHLLNQALGRSWQYGNNKGLLRFYLQLTDYQRSLLFSEKGLDPHILSPTQWPYYAEMFAYGRRYNWWGTEEFTDLGSTDVRMKATVKWMDASTMEDGAQRLLPNEEGGMFYYRFTAYLTREDGSTKDNWWGVWLSRVALPSKPSSHQTIKLP